MIDTHCHLDSCEPPVAELVGRARAAGVTRMATVGMNGPSMKHALTAAEGGAKVGDLGQLFPRVEAETPVA